MTTSLLLFMTLLKPGFVFRQLFINFRIHLTTKTKMIRANYLLKSLGAVIVSALILASCSKSNDSNPSSLIAGNWTVSTTTLTDSVNGGTLTEFYVGQGLSQSDAQLAAQAISSTIQQSFTGTINVKSDHTYVLTIAGNSQSGTWSINSAGDKLTTDPGTPAEVVYDIVHLDAHNLEIRFQTSIMQDINNDGTPETIDITADMTLTK